jgi:carbon storage regulator
VFAFLWADGGSSRQIGTTNILQGGDAMLVLTRKIGQKIRIGDHIELTVLKVSGQTLRLGITAPAHTPIHRDEVYQRIEAEQRQHHPENVTF